MGVSQFFFDSVAYLWAILSWWWFLIPGLLLGIFSMWERIYQREIRVPKHVLPWVMLGGIFLSGFFAWRDERAQVRTLKKRHEQIAQLEKKLTPRQIGDRKGISLIKALSSTGRYRVTVECVLGDAESCKYAEDFKRCLKAAGWVVEHEYYHDPPFQRIWVNTRTSAEVPQGAEILARILRQHEIEVNVGVDPQLESGSFSLVIGSKF